MPQYSIPARTLSLVAFALSVAFSIAFSVPSTALGQDGVRFSLMGGFHPEGTTRGSFPVDGLPVPPVESGNGFEGAFAVDDLTHEYLAFGGRLSVLSTDAVVAGEEGTLVSVALSFAPRLRIPVSVVEFYFSPSFGLSLTTPPSENFDLGEGYHIDLVGGLHVNASDHIGLFVEAGFSSHWVSFPAELTDTMGIMQSVPFTVRLQRFVVRIGVSYEVF